MTLSVARAPSVFDGMALTNNFLQKFGLGGKGVWNGWQLDAPLSRSSLISSYEWYRGPAFLQKSTSVAEA